MLISLKKHSKRNNFFGIWLCVNFAWQTGQFFLFTKYYSMLICSNTCPHYKKKGTYIIS